MNTKGQPALSWHKETSSFILKIPGGSPPYSPNLQRAFNTELLSLFGMNSNEVLDGEWATVTHELPKRNKSSAQTPSGTMPALETLSRPEVLFKNLAPYHLFLRETHQSVVIQASHQPSLELLYEYLKKWTKTMQNDSRGLPVLKISLEESKFGLGVLYDSLIVEPTDERQTWVRVNPVLIISFIECILQYQMVMTPMAISGTYFRREEAFA